MKQINGDKLNSVDVKLVDISATKKQCLKVKINGL